MVQRIYFLALFLREASRKDGGNAVPELESHNLYLFFQAVQIKNQTVGWVTRPLDPEAVFPKENELVEVFGLLSYARGLAHGAALEPHVASAWHRYSILHASVLMILGLDCCKVFVQPIFSLFSVYFPDTCVYTKTDCLSTVLDIVGINESGISVVLH